MRDGDIWYADWNGSDWNTPVKLGPQINRSPGIDQSPSVSADGQKLYFVADSREGHLWDIWVSTWNPSLNDWGTPVNVGYPVNTPGVEFSAHLAPDGRLFFSSSADPDSLFPFGRYGIYVSEWNGSSWSVPEEQWAQGSIPYYPSVPADGQWLYFHDISDIYVARWNGSGWEFPAYNLRQQLGGRGATPSIVPSGDSLFFQGGPDLGGGNGDIFLSKRIDLSKVPAGSNRTLLFLIFILSLAGIYWITVTNTLKQT
ncbi:MAG: hypothetical protein L0196_07510 [candidate division Zixibacteria bacterium]|nr:hypothetical protein [candidate division Zixibacteria bacterium]